MSDFEIILDRKTFEFLQHLNTHRNMKLFLWICLNWLYLKGFTTCSWINFNNWCKIVHVSPLTWSWIFKYCYYSCYTGFSNTNERIESYFTLIFLVFSFSVHLFEQFIILNLRAKLFFIFVKFKSNCEIKQCSNEQRLIIVEFEFF